MKHKTIAIFAILCISFNTSLNAFQQKQDIEFKNTIQRTLDSLYNETEDFGGATVGIVLPNNSQYQFAIGYANVDKQLKMTIDHVMLGGSTGKVYISAAIMQQIEQGHLNLEDKVIDFLKDYKWFNRIQNYNTITVRNLMQHSSGISRYVLDDTFLFDVQKDADRQWKPEELLSYVFDQVSLFEAGEDFTYSDTNYILLAMVLEKVTGKTMYNYIDEYILKPHHLSHTKPQITRNISNLAVGYNATNGLFYPGVLVENETYKYNIQFEWAGGGYSTTSLDLARAGKFIYENKLFSKSLNSDFYKGINAKELGGQWGLGVHITDSPNGKSYGHSGFFPGYITNMLYYPDSGFSIAFQVNTSDGKKLSLYRKLYQLIPLVKNYINK